MAQARAAVGRWRCAVQRMRHTLAFVDRFSFRVSAKAFQATEAHLTVIETALGGLQDVLDHISARIAGRPDAADVPALERTMERLATQLDHLRRANRSRSPQPSGETHR